MQKIFTFRRKALAISGNVLANSWPSKNWRWISGQPGALTTAKPSPVKTTAVLTRAMTTPRRLSLRLRVVSAAT
jgi:hypothetical protein